MQVLSLGRGQVNHVIPEFEQAPPQLQVKLGRVTRQGRQVNEEGVKVCEERLGEAGDLFLDGADQGEGDVGQPPRSACKRRIHSPRRLLKVRQQTLDLKDLGRHLFDVWIAAWGHGDSLPEPSRSPTKASVACG